MCVNCTGGFSSISLAVRSFFTRLAFCADTADFLVSARQHDVEQDVL